MDENEIVMDALRNQGYKTMEDINEELFITVNARWYEDTQNVGCVCPYCGKLVIAIDEAIDWYTDLSITHCDHVIYVNTMNYGEENGYVTVTFSRTKFQEFGSFSHSWLYTYYQKYEPEYLDQFRYNWFCWARKVNLADDLVNN